MEPNPQECSKETAWALIKSMGNSYKCQINKLRNTNLDFLYVTKDTKNNCIYIDSVIHHNLKIDTGNFIGNDNVFKEVGDIINAMQYYNLVVYVIII